MSEAVNQSMLSRVANSIYWMNRYIERAENVARFIDVNIHLMLDLPSGTDEQWEPLVYTAGDQDLFNKHYDEPSRHNVIRFLMFDEANPNSIISSVKAARENARTVREIISSEMWQQVNVFNMMVHAVASNPRVLDEPQDLFFRIKQASHLFEGIMDGTMSHNEAWHFGRMGRLLERADKTSRIVDVKYFLLLPAISDVGTPFDNIQWSALLKSASALEMYRKRFGLIAPARVVEFLILDREFPRSLHSCLIRAQSSLRAVTGSQDGTFQNSAEQYLGRLVSELNYARIEEIVQEGLHEFIDRFQRHLNRVDDSVFETFFAMRPIASQMQYQQM